MIAIESLNPHQRWESEVAMLKQASGEIELIAFFYTIKFNEYSQIKV